MRTLSIQRRHVLWTGLGCAALLLFYVVSPYFSFWRLTVAAQAGDREALTARVDFPAVRDGLKQQLRDEFIGQLANKKAKRFASLISGLAPSLLDTIVDAYVTPEGIAALLVHPPSRQDVHSLAQLKQRQEDRSFGRKVDWSKVKHAYFTGPRSFAVDLEGTKLRFGFTGFGWRLKRIELPFDHTPLEQPPHP